MNAADTMRSHLTFSFRLKTFASGLGRPSMVVLAAIAALGACLAMPRRVVDEMQGFDERFWMWFDEVDLCLRVRQAGYRVRFLPDPVVIHRLNQSAVLLHSVFSQRMYSQSLVRFFAKHHPVWHVAMLRSVSWVGVAAAHAVQFIRRLRDRSGARHRIKAA